MRLDRAARVLLALCLAAGACSRGEPRKADEAGGEGKTDANPASSAPTPVRVAPVETANLAVVVSGPGKTVALSQQKVRAPFAGTLTELHVSDGDVVRRGQAIGAMVARESEAALSGARQMAREASTPAARADAERAVALAESNVVRRTLAASADGVVASHAASAGDRLAEDQEILTINDSGSLVFVADLPQADLPKIRPGQPATVQIAGSTPVAASVHAILPAANSADFTGSVRLDLPASSQRLALGIFGTARISVDEHRAAIVVPDAAVLRDDVSGVTRIALVQEGRAHWVNVRTGLSQSGRTEILEPALRAGQPVIVAGLVGLPEGKAVASQGR
jgi:Cu(I)/Ag(I) efflux system membrane fusion protein